MSVKHHRSLKASRPQHKYGQLLAEPDAFVCVNSMNAFDTPGDSDQS